ncbi:MAG: copper amine oxidase N-terminal domain-containing protein [Defluviitaleaceae bacterium]|nr:copper amine oxidase N-terminal domain-containing protein [Defluviitaleaceae bacterium]
MKKFKRIGAVALAAAITLAATGFLVIDPVEISEDSTSGYDYEWTMPQIPTFMSFNGNIVEIDSEWVEDTTRILVQNEHGSTMNFIVDFNTFIRDGEELEIGQNITGFYYSMAAAILIYPPQHPVRFIATTDTSVAMDRFEVMEMYGNNDTLSLISHGNDFILNISDDTPIHLQDGQNVREILEGRTLADFLNNRMLIVTHGPLNRAMIPGTIPGIDEELTVTVLFELAVHLPGLIDFELIDFDLGFADPEPIQFVYNYGISVEGRMVDALWREIDGGFYVPFRAVVNLLRFGPTVSWDDESRSITVENGTELIAFSVGSNEFRVGERVVTLDHPALLVVDTTYVPFQFFSQVFGVNNAWMSGGQIFIDNEEIMQ